MCVIILRSAHHLNVSLTEQKSLSFDVDKQFDLCIKFLMLLLSAFLIGKVGELACKEIALWLRIYFLFYWILCKSVNYLNLA